MQQALGGIARVPNPLDFPLGAFTQPAYIPDVFLPDISGIPVDNQKKIPACGSHSAAALQNIQEGLWRFSPAWLWKKIKQIDNYPPESGTDLLSIMKVLNQSGACEYDLLPNNTDTDLATYTDPKTLTLDMDINAMKFKTGAYAFTFSPSLQQIKEAIYTHKAVIALLRIGPEFWTPSWQEKDILPLRIPSSIVGGHFVTLYGYDHDRIFFRNSWSDAWGQNGNGYFDANYLPYVVEIGTTINLPNIRFRADLWYGSVGLDVWALQRYLVKNGFGNYTPTGFFGTQTLASVKAFQAKYGIQTTGYVGPITRAKLNQLWT